VALLLKRSVFSVRHHWLPFSGEHEPSPPW
jgi:hypothetical protein